MAENNTLARFVIDEAHCVDTWGQSFRPSYGELDQLKQFGRPISAFTGTATNESKERIVLKLGFVDPVTIQSTCDRPNLSYIVIPKSGPHSKEDLVKYVQENFHDKCGIVDCVLLNNKRNSGTSLHLQVERCSSVLSWST